MMKMHYFLEGCKLITGEVGDCIGGLCTLGFLKEEKIRGKLNEKGTSTRIGDKF